MAARTQIQDWACRAMHEGRSFLAAELSDIAAGLDKDDEQIPMAVDAAFAADFAARSSSRKHDVDRDRHTA